MPMEASKRKGETKRQHYVPQFILRNFSRDDRNTSILRLDDGLVVPAGPLKSQCYEDYFYGEDQAMEKSFAKSEAEVSGLLGDLSHEQLASIPTDALIRLKNFVHYQTFRTRAAVEQQAEFVASFIKQATLTTQRLNGKAIDAEALSAVRLINPNGVSDAIWQAARSTPALHDLGVKFLVSEHSLGFVIADHPVVYCNQLAEHDEHLRKRPNLTGFLSKGLQVFLPLSSSVTMMLYDPLTYEFHTEGPVCRVGPRDVTFLNKAQAVNALKCVFFDSTRTTHAVRGKPKVGFNLIAEMLDCRRRHPDVHRTQIQSTELYRKPGNSMGQMVAVARNDVRVGAVYSFLRVLDHSSYADFDGPAAPERSREQTEFVQTYAHFVDMLDEEQRETSTPLEEVSDETIHRIALSATRRYQRRTR